MRMMLSIALAGATACGFSSPGSSAGDDSNSVPDAPPGDPATDDNDGDGVLNTDDNCVAVANSDQFNEDGDARGDACDPCPQLAQSTDDADRDGDGIGDGCDPRPDLAGDKLVYWNGFHISGSDLPEGLSKVHGDPQRWSVANDHLVFSRNADDWNIPAFDTHAESHTVDATFEITASYTVLSAAAVGVAADIASNDKDMSECQARIDAQARQLWYWNGRGAGDWTQLDNNDTATPNGIYRIVLQRTPTELACATTRNGTMIPLTSTRASTRNTRAGLFARNVDARFQYLAIYTSP